MTQFLEQKNKGFVIMFAILISTIILLISVGVFRMIQKEVVLSSYARESQRAFFVADSALECALYADIHGVGAENPTTPFSVNPEIAASVSNFLCGGRTVTSIPLDDGTPEYEYAFVLRYNNTYSPKDIGCAYVLVEKNERSTDLDIIETRITAIGFNVCMEGNISDILDTPDTNDPTLLERRLSIVYTR